jgi:hypothetical protein
MSNEINPMNYKNEPPKSFDGMKLDMIFHTETKKAKLFLKNFVDGWSIIVWSGNISDTVSEICAKNSKAVIESTNETLKLLCMYKIKFSEEIRVINI